MPKKVTPRTELETKYDRFETEVIGSESVWKVFAQLVMSRNHATSIARELKKNKSIVSRQLRKLAQLRLVVPSGTGVKQSYTVDWVILTTYWVWHAEYAALFASAIYKDRKFQEIIFDTDRTPDWLRRLRLTDEEKKQVSSVESLRVQRVLEPVIHQLAQIVQRVVETLVNAEDILTFWDAFSEISLAFRIGLPDEKLIDTTTIDIPSSRQVIEALYNPTVQTWFKLQVAATLAGSTVVENYVSRLAGLIRG